MRGLRIRRVLERIAFKVSKYKRAIKVLVLSAIILVIVAIFAGQPIANAIQHRLLMHRFNNLSHDDFLYDFNYLMNALEENWPFFNLSISVNDVNVRELADNFRASLSDTTTSIDGAHGFLDLLRKNFIWPIDNLGHLMAVWQYQSYFEQMDDIRWRASMGMAESIQFLYQILRPETAIFYETLRDAGGSTLLPLNTPMTTELAPVLEFNIIEEGEIAHISINRMIHFWDNRDAFNPLRMGYYERLFFDFHMETIDYSHLILDLRGNPGGIHFFFDWVMAGLYVTDETWFPAYIFFKGGDYSVEAIETFGDGVIGAAAQVGEPIDFLTNPLPYLDTSINFTYAFKSEYGILPRHMFDEDTHLEIFNGKIWMLVDEHTASSAEAVAAMFKYNNLATVVGEATRGILGTNYDPLSAILSLPNTGILVRFDVVYFTDTQGRPLQGYGVIPNYFNRSGMDAMETVLAMIAERED